MVSSYLICDACGQYGPPAGFLHENGLRLCYPCWYRERCETLPPTDRGNRAPVEPAPKPDAPDQNR